MKSGLAGAGRSHASYPQASSALAFGRFRLLPDRRELLLARRPAGEVAELVQLVGVHRLVTLTGPGGIGKTRLSQEAARRLLSQLAHGVWFVELASLANPDLVALSVAATVGAALPAGLVSAERVAAALAGKASLIVLDNCEQVIDGAALVVDALLYAAPAVHVLATSREPLRTEGEQVYPVGSLAVSAKGPADCHRRAVDRGSADGYAPRDIGGSRTNDGAAASVSLTKARNWH